MFGRLRKLLSPPPPVARPAPAPLSTPSGSRPVRARYDSAQTNDDNRRHWAWADSLSAGSANTPEIRRTLRMRARYEVANCPLARSIIGRMADAVVGTGPRLQIRTRDRDYNRTLEAAFAEWAIASKFARKLWQMRFCLAMNGEAFGIFVTNPPLKLKTPVTLDVKALEADQVADPRFSSDPSDGIIYDDFGNPFAYRILRNHPGDTMIYPSLASEFETVRAVNVIHLFNDHERPGTLRGVPEITAALPYLSMRRRYILSVLAAAETAADLAAVIKTQQTPSDDADDLEPYDTVEIERRMMVTLPKGWEPFQFRAEQPQTTLEMFDGVLIREIARCFNMPYGVASLDSSRYNFASGKLDHLPWIRTKRIEQDRLEDIAARPTFLRWFAEASRIPGYLPPAPVPGMTPAYRFLWDGDEFLDPREATAKETGLRNGFETHAEIFARRGQDVEDEWESAAADLGITPEEYRAKIIDAVWKPAPEPPVPGEAPVVEEETANA